MADFIINAVRNIEGVSTDVAVRDGRIVALTPAAEGGGASGDIDGRGHVLLPPLVESHVHLDKTLWGEPWPPTVPARRSRTTSPMNAASWPRSPRRSASVRGLLEHCIAQGSLHVRSHIDVAPDIGVKHVEAMLELRAAYGDVVDMQFVAFPQTGLLMAPGTAS